MATRVEMWTLSRNHPGLSRSQRRNARRADKRAAARAAVYYPATVKTFRDSVAVQRRLRLFLLDTGEPDCFNICVYGLAIGHRMRQFVWGWREAAAARRHERAVVRRCFEAWAWHPGGALAPLLAARFTKA